jgi:hypothetical protein
LQPPKRPESPNSGRPLKLKDLTTVNFEIDMEKKQGAGGGAGRYICALSKKEIIFQDVIILKKSGQVVLLSVNALPHACARIHS